MQEKLKTWLESDRTVSLAAAILDWRLSVKEKEEAAGVLADRIELEDERTGPVSAAKFWRLGHMTGEHFARYVIQMLADGPRGLLHPYLNCSCLGCQLVRAVRDPDFDPPLLLTREVPR